MVECVIYWYDRSHAQLNCIICVSKVSTWYNWKCYFQWSNRLLSCTPKIEKATIILLLYILPAGPTKSQFPRKEESTKGSVLIWTRCIVTCMYRCVSIMYGAYTIFTSGGLSWEIYNIEHNIYNIITMLEQEILTQHSYRDCYVLHSGAETSNYVYTLSDKQTQANCTCGSYNIILYMCNISLKRVCLQRA